MVQTLKEYIEEQREKGLTPHFTNIPADAPPGAFVYEEDPFTAETEKMLEEPGGGFQYSEDVPGLIPEEPQEFSMAEAQKTRSAPPPKPTAETVTPGAPVPGSKTARYAMDQKIPKAIEKIPAKPPAEELTPEFKSRAKFRDKVASNIEKRTGFNPLTFNYLEEAERQTEAEAPDLFRETFGGRKAYHMIKHLDPKEKKVWSAAIQARAAANENKLKLTSDQISKQLNFGMKKFDDTQKEVGKLQVGMKQNLSPLFITVNEDGKKIGQIPPGVLPKAVARATTYVHGGMSAADAGNKVTQEMMAEQLQIQNKRQGVASALSGIQSAGSWTSKADLAMAETASKAALEAGATREQVKNELLAQNYKEHQISKILPAEGATTVVSRETKTGEQPVVGTLGGKEVRSLNDLANIIKEDPTLREAGKPLYAKLRK